MAFLFISIFYQERGQIRKEKPTFTKEIAKCDPLSVCLLISAFTCLLLALQWADITYAWSDSHVYGCLLGFGLLLAVFSFVQIWKREKYAFLKAIPGQTTNLFLVRSFRSVYSLNALWRLAAPSSSSSLWKLVYSSTIYLSTFRPS